jgi:integrase
MAKQSDGPVGIRARDGGFQIRIRRTGFQDITETIKGTSKAALATAVARRKEILERLNVGLSASLPKAPGSRLFHDVAQRYLHTLQARDATKREYHRILNGWWMGLAYFPMSEITAEQIKEILADMNVSSKTKKNRLIPLYGVFDHCEIPHPKIKLLKSQPPGVDRYTPKERKKLLSKLSGQELVYFALLFATGMRPGEALALQWSDYVDGRISITKSISKRQLGNTKNSIRRRVYVPTWVRPILNAHTTRFNGGHIFTNSLGTACLDTDIFNQAWKVAHEKARLSYRIPYTCRHTRAAEMLSLGVVPARAAKELGHSTEMFYRVYSEFLDEYTQDDTSLLEGVGT